MSIPTPEKYIKDFEQLGFGLFVHWGLYSQIGQGEAMLSVNATGYPYGMATCVRVAKAKIAK